MAMKTLEYHCPHCNRKLSSVPQNDYCAIGGQYYGEPMETCRKCKKNYRRPIVTEAAQSLTLRQQVPFWLTGVRTLVTFIILAVFSVVFGMLVESLLGLLLIAGAYLLLCAGTRKHRQAHKNQVLQASRKRMQEPAYFSRYLAQAIGTTGLAPEKLALCHAEARSAMERDQPLDVAQLARIARGERA